MHHIPDNMDQGNILRSVFSGGIDWDSREPYPPNDDEKATEPSIRDAHPRRPWEVATYGTPNVPGSRDPSPPVQRLRDLNSAGPGTRQDSLPDVPRAPRPRPKPQPWGFHEPPNTASIYFPDNFSQPRKNVVSEFGRSVLTPLSVDVAVFVVHNTAKMTVTHVFYNESPQPIDKASYAFPIPSVCTLTGFSYRIGSRKVVAVVEPAAQAREKFAKAVREKRTAALLELDKEDTEIVMAQLGNIPGETKITTEFELVLLLERRIVGSDDAEASVTTLTIPTTMASRYGGSVAEAYGKPIGMKKGISINVEVVQSPELQDLALWSPTHNINSQSGTRNQKAQSIFDLPNSADATKNKAHSILKASLVDENRLLDKDFVLQIKSKPEAGGPKAQAWLGQHTDPDLPNQQALMIHIPPLALSSASRSKGGEVTGEIVFLLDQSNSMEDKIGALTKATRFFLQNIPSGWKFNIWRFGSTYTSLWPSTKKRQEENFNEALRWLEEKCQGNMGGSEVIGALKAVLKNTSCPTQVLLLTDGQVWHLEEALELIKNTRQESRRPIRFFCLGIGDMISSALVEGLADSGGGHSDVIYFQDPSWGEKLVAMLVSILAVHTKPIRVLLNGKLVTEPALQSPGIISRLNVLQEDSIFLLVDSHRGQDIRSVDVFFATEDGEEMEISIPVHVLDKNDTTIHKFAARALLDDLELGRSSIYMQPKGPDQAQSIRERAEDIACRWKLLSKWTSFVMPDQKDSDEPLIPPTSRLALMQTRLLPRNPKVDSRLIEDRLEDEEALRAGQSRDPARLVSSPDDDSGLFAMPLDPSDMAAHLPPPPMMHTPPPPPPVIAAPPPPPPPMEATPPRFIGDDEDEVVVVEEHSTPRRRSKHKNKTRTRNRRSKHNLENYEASYSSTEESEEVPRTTKDRTRLAQEEFDGGEREKRRGIRGEEQRRGDEWHAWVEHEILTRREAEEYARRADEYVKRAERRSKRVAEAVAERTAEERVRGEEEKRAAERARLEVERRARDEQLHARKEEETRREFQKRFEELAKMIAELAERVRRKEAEDREAARKEAEERARREEEERRRADWERERRILEREMREAARGDAERRLSQTNHQVGQRLGYARAVEENEEATPQMGQRANGGRGRAPAVGEERIWRLGVLIQDRMGRREPNGAVALIGRLLSDGESQSSGVLLFLALLTVAGMAVFAMTCVFLFVSSFMFLSSWMIALRIFRI